MRTTESWNDGWQFRREEEGEWRAVRLPHDWSVEGPFDEAAPAGGDGGYLPCGIGLYRKRFRMDGDLPQSCVIGFEGVMQRAQAWVNGTFAGGRPFGYLGFELEAARLLVPGENLIELRVDNSAQPASRWYSGSGVTRPVTLSTGVRGRILRDGVRVRTEDLEAGRISIRAAMETAGLDGMAAEAAFALLDGDRLLEERTAQVGPGGEAGVEFMLSDPRRWSHATPELYRLRVRLGRMGAGPETGEGRVEWIDERIVPFGIRTIDFDRDRGFLVDGRPVKLRGVCLHHDGGAVGAAVPPAVWQRRLEMLKRMGCNAVRMSHNPPDPALLDLCDALGFYVMDEAFDEWRIRKWKNGIGEHGYGDLWDENHVRDLTDLVRRDRNHPSVVLWSIGNEIPEQSEPDGDAIARELTAIVRRLDATRPVTSACDRIRAEPEPARESFLNALDVVGANYVNRWRLRTETMYEEERFAHPEWTLIGSEHGSAAGFRARYELDGEEPHPWFGDYRTRIVRAAPLLRFTETRDWVAGDFMWTGVDYLGECRWPHKNASCGVLDTCGFEKDAFHFYRSVWTDAPMLHLFPHWNWTGREGQVIPVLCCTNCDTVELFLNGRSWGRKTRQFPLQGMTQAYGHFDRNLPQPTTSDLHLQWDVPFEPGRVSAVGWREGRIVCEWAMETSGPAAALEAAEWRGRTLELPTDALVRDYPWDMRQIEIALTDEAGRPVPDAELAVEAQTEGVCRLVALDNGMPEDRTVFSSPVRRTLGGRLLAIVERTGSGSAALLLRAEGIRERRIELKEACGETRRRGDGPA